MRWAIEIKSTQLERRNLTELLGRLGFALIEETSHPAFTSANIDECATASEAYEIAKSVRNAFAGAANIDSTFELGGVIDYSRNPPARHIFLEVHEVIHSHQTFFGATLTVSPSPWLSKEEIKVWREKRKEAEYQAKLDSQLSKLEPAYFNSKAVRVLELLAIESHSGESLYKIYELMRGLRTNATAFGHQFGITNDDFRRFSDAVHLDSVTGDWARHAHGDPPTSENPMNKAEAESFVRAIASRWLEHIRSTRTD